MNIVRSLTRSPWRYVAILFLTAAVVVLLARFSGISALERWQRNMRQRGEKLTVADLAPPRGPTNDTTLSQLRLVTDRLETRAIRPAEFVAIVSTSPGRAQPAWAQTDVHVNYGTTTLVDWSKVRTEMEAARADLDRIRDALLHPPPSRDITYGEDTSIPNQVAVRLAAQWLSGAILNDLHEGQLAEAQERLNTSIKLIHLYQDDLLLVTQMMRVAIANLELETTWSALQAPGWTETSLSELQHRWEEVHFLEKFAPSMAMERALRAKLFTLGRSKGIQAVRTRTVLGASPTQTWDANLKEFFLDHAWRILWSDADELYYWQASQPGVEAVRRAVQHRSFQRLRTELTSTGYPTTPAALSRYDSMRYQLTQLLQPNFMRAHEYVVRAEAHRNLAVTAIAIQRYRLRHGAPPPNLAALVPEFLTSAPLDYMNGQPLRYRLEPNEDYCLYSVGLDGQDDGGDPHYIAPWTRYTDTIWDGRDGVWPRFSVEELKLLSSSGVLPLVQFEDAPLLDVLKTLARQDGLDVSFDPRINWSQYPLVNVRLESVKTIDVIRAVLKNNNLEMTKRRGTNVLDVTIE